MAQVGVVLGAQPDDDVAEHHRHEGHGSEEPEHARRQLLVRGGAQPVAGHVVEGGVPGRAGEAHEIGHYPDGPHGDGCHEGAQGPPRARHQRPGLYELGPERHPHDDETDRLEDEQPRVALERVDGAGGAPGDGADHEQPEQQRATGDHRMGPTRQFHPLGERRLPRLGPVLAALAESRARGTPRATRAGTDEGEDRELQRLHELIAP